jgi:DNA-binding IclR family transcriptional regulator
MLILRRTNGKWQCYSNRTDKGIQLSDDARGPAPENAKNPGSIQVIERMVALLDALAVSPESASLKQLATATDLHPSTAHRILAAMTASRFVERHDTGTYRLGIRLLELGNIVKSRINLREVALPFMQELHETIGEAVNLGARHEDDIVYLERTSSGRALVRVVYLVGGRAPLHLTSLGKLFLAADSPQDVRAYAKRTALPGKTPHSLTSLAALERELDKVRRHGIAYDDEEAEIGLKCVAAPIHDDEGRVVAALSVSAPADRHDLAWALQVRRSADAVSLALGYSGTKK